MRAAAANLDGGHAAAQLEGADIALNELISRQSSEFYVSHYAAGYSLALRGMRILESPAGHSPSISATFAALPLVIGSECRFDRIADEVTVMTRILQYIVAALSGDASDEAVRFMDQVVDWEVSLYRYREQNAEGFASREILPPPITGQTLLAYLEARFPEWRGLKLKSFRPLFGGFSKSTLLFEIEDQINGSQALVARVAPLHNFLNLEAYDLAKEYRLLRYAYRSGLPVPEQILLEEDPSAVGARFIISRMAPGRTIGTIKESSEPLSEAVISDIAKTLAKIHTVSLIAEDPDLARSHIPRWLTGDLESNTAAFVADWREETMRSNIDPSPAVERGLSWLEANVPHVEGRPGLVHGDFGVHNFLVENGRVSAVLDWEVSRAGDPAEDITNFFSGSGSLIDRDQFMRAYVAAGGLPIEPMRLRYFDVYHCVKILVAGLAALQQIERWDSVTISHATFGFRYMTFAADHLNNLIALAEDAALGR